MTDQPSPSQALQQQEPPRQPPAPPVPAYMLDDGPPPFWTTLDPKEPYDQSIILKCSGDADEKATDWVNKTFHTRHVYAEPRESTNQETGDVESWIATVLVNPDGRTLSFGSIGVLKSLKLIVALKGKGPWEPPLPLTLRQKDKDGKKRLYLLELAVEAPVTNPKGRVHVKDSGKPGG